MVSEEEMEPLVFNAQQCPLYKYVDLATPTSIRVISGLREETRDGIPVVDTSHGVPFPILSFEIQTVDLNDGPIYDCLSYTWGRPTRVTVSKEVNDQADEYYSKKAAVLCDGKLLWIGRNLYCFLQRVLQIEHAPVEVKEHHFARLCGKDRSTLCWVDSICINQEDREERGRQVRIMDRIYGAANIVLAWLGDNDGYSKPAMHSLAALAELDPDVAERAKSINPLNGDLSEIGIHDEIDLYAIYAFLKRSWFRRAWVVQEAVLAERLVIWCGSIQIPFALLVMGSRFLFQSGWFPAVGSDIKTRRETGFGLAVGKLLPSTVLSNTASTLAALEGFRPGPYEAEGSFEVDFDPIYAINRILELRLAFGKETSMAISNQEYPRLTYQELLTSFRLTESGEPKDKVYAFLGMRPVAEIPEALRPNYRKDKSYQEVYTEATLYLLQSTKTLNLLSYKEDVSRGRDTDLPSWVPDFSKPILETIEGEILRPWSAAGDVPFHLTSGWPQNKVLTLHGLFVDEVSDSATWDRADLSSVSHLFFRLQRFYNVNSPPGQSLPTLAQDQISGASDSISRHPIPSPTHHEPHTASENESIQVQGRIEVLWRTLLADCCQHEHPAPLKYGFAFVQTLLNELSTMMIARNIQNYHHDTEERDRKIALLSNAVEAFMLFEHDEPKTTPREEDEPCDTARLPIRFLPNMDELAYKIRNDELKYRHDEAVGDFASRSSQMLDHRILFTTAEQRYLGLGPQSLRPGDQVWLLAGAKVPHVLRPKENGKFELVGECYVHGIMHGEAARGRETDFVPVELE